MADFELVAPARETTLSFSLEPAHNAVCDLMLLESDVSGAAEWVEQTRSAMQPDLRQTNRLFFSALNPVKLLEGGPWSGVQEWADDLSQRDPRHVRDVVLGEWQLAALSMLDEDVETASLLGDRAVFLSVADRICCEKDKEADLALYRRAHELLNDPPALLDLIVTHLGTMWQRFLAPEWTRNLPALQAALAALRAIDQSGASTDELVRRIIERELPPSWREAHKEADRVLLIPSVHIGPYVALMGVYQGTARVVFGARVAESSPVQAPAISRSALLMRLNALADSTRLAIVEALATEGELSTQDIIDRFGLSQSSASRHLRQLTATGLLQQRRREIAKLYSLDMNSLEAVYDALDRLNRQD